MNRETLEFDVVIVGAGPAGLSASIRLAQLGQQYQQNLSICVIDKSENIGNHILSGAVLEPHALNELIPDWQTNPHPFIHTPVVHDEFLYFTKNHAIKFPTPPQMKNSGNYIISLGLMCRWLASIAENLGVNIFPGFAATDILYHDQDQHVCGVITGDKGLDKHGKPKSNYQPGIALRAKQVMFAEGCRGSLTKELFSRYRLQENICPQTYGLGIKELWEIPPSLHKPGRVTHSIGWPLDNHTYGGSFVYHFATNLLAIGFVVGLDYQNPYLNPYEEFQQFKTHPSIRPLLEQGRRIAYGARTIIEGGLQCIPKLSFPGGVIVGDAAGFLNVPKIKGINNAMKSAMIAAESIFPLLQKSSSEECLTYLTHLQQSWLWEDLYKVRNIRPAMRWGLWPGLAYAALDTYIFRGKAPWTLKHAIPDNLSLKKIAQCEKINYPKHDNKITFDLPSSVFLAHVAYDENQPCHLILKDKNDIPININLHNYDSPESRYCPAGVYEILYDENNKPQLHINNGNCIHCKACDIKDPMQNITWIPSEGGSGPNYEMM